MSQSRIIPTRERVIDWIFLSSIKFFIWLASLAVPFLFLAFLLRAFLWAPLFFGHMLGIVQKAPADDDHAVPEMFAGIVISLLLCIAIRINAFDWLKMGNIKEGDNGPEGGTTRLRL